MTVVNQTLQNRIRNTTVWLTSCALAFGGSVALAGYIGLSKSMKIMTARPPASLVSSTIPLPPPVHDPHKPTVAVLLGNTFSEPTDVLGPYAMFAESGEYNVYTVAASRTIRTLSGGLDLVPHLSFEDLATRLHGDPDIVVVPQIVDIRASINAPVVAWVKRQAHGHALLFSWCTGSEVLAESGALDGKAATAHWGDIDRLQRIYPRVHWQRGVRYVDGGSLLSTAGLTAGVDATLHFLARRNGGELAAKVADGLHIPPSPFVENPQCRQFELGPADAIFVLNAGFRWPKPRLSVWLYDGVGELDLGSAADVYGVSAAYQIHTLSTAASVVSRHGIQFVPRKQVRTVSPEPSLALRNEGSQQFAYVAAVEDLALRQDTWTARFAAKRLEIRTPLRVEGDSWSFRVVLVSLFIGCAMLALLFWLKRAVQRQRQIGLELKVAPVALAVIAAALMWCAALATPEFNFRFPSNRGSPWFFHSLAPLPVSPALSDSGVRRPR
jgi:putative intracellular protease/amidase